MGNVGKRENWYSYPSGSSHAVEASHSAHCTA
jgi:hypothetical protein